MKKNTTPRKECVFSCSDKLCETLDRAGVPADGKWRTLIVYMRGLKDFSVLSDRQKNDIQSLLIRTIKRADYSDAAFSNILAKKQEILMGPCTKKLEAAISEATGMVREFGKILHKRKGDVEGLGCSCVEAVERGGDPELLITRLRGAFAEVIQSMTRDADDLERLSYTDALTGLANRRAFDGRLDRAVFEHLEHQGPISLLMIDIDHFKRFNDQYGHLVGDQALTAAAKLIAEVGASVSATLANVTFFPARFGGEEFAVVLEGMDLIEATAAGEAVRKRVEEYNFLIRDPDGTVRVEGIRLTVSVGAAELKSIWTGALAENLIDAADKALYAAKAGGRNRLVAFDQLVSPTHSPAHAAASSSVA